MKPKINRLFQQTHRVSETEKEWEKRRERESWKHEPRRQSCSQNNKSNNNIVARDNENEDMRRLRCGVKEPAAAFDRTPIPACLPCLACSWTRCWTPVRLSSPKFCVTRKKANDAGTGGNWWAGGGSLHAEWLLRLCGCKLKQSWELSLGWTDQATRERERGAVRQ